MTLVIAALTGTRVEMLADSQIDDPNAIRGDRVPGRLKIVVLSPSLAVAYAGRAAAAIDLIRQVSSGGDLDKVDAVAEQLRAATEQNDHQVDFLVGWSGDQCRLLKIADGGIFEGLERYWIGNSTAASAYARILEQQVAWERLTDVHAEEILRNKLVSTFEQFLSSGAVAEVGGIPYRACGTPAGFVYASFAGVDYPEQTIPLPGSPRLGAAADGALGAYSYSVVVPGVPGVAMVGLYMLQGRVGFLHRPLVTDAVECGTSPRLRHQINAPGCLARVISSRARGSSVLPAGS